MGVWGFVLLHVVRNFRLGAASIQTSCTQLLLPEAPKIHETIHQPWLAAPFRPTSSMQVFRELFAMLLAAVCGAAALMTELMLVRPPCHSKGICPKRKADG